MSKPTNNSPITVGGLGLPQDPGALARLRALAQTEADRQAQWLLISPRFVLELLQRLDYAGRKPGGYGEKR